MAGWIIVCALVVSGIGGGVVMTLLIIRRMILKAVRRAIHDFAADVLLFQRRNQRIVLRAAQKKLEGKPLSAVEGEFVEMLRQLSAGYRGIF